MFCINLPALKERKKDIPLLAQSFVAYFSTKNNKKELELAPEYLKALEQNVWKGNIRELKNVIERSIILADDSTLDLSTLPLEFQYSDNGLGTMMSALSMASVEKLQIQKVLNHTKGNKAEAARLLEIGIATLYRKIEEYKL